MVTFPLALVNIIISGCLRGAGDTKTPMLIANIVNIVNVFLGFILIFGIRCPVFNIHGTGITGAGWAVAISRAVGGILSIAALYRPLNQLRTDLFKKFSFNTGLMKRILKVGIPAAMEQIVMQGGFLVLQVMISGMGTIAIAVYQICMSVNSISYIPVWGFGIGATTLVGQSLGAGKPNIAEKCSWSTLKIAVSVIVILTTVIFIFPDKLISIYNSDPGVIRAGTAAIRIFSLSQPFLAVVVVISGSLRGAGDITYVMITSFIGIWGFRILVTLLMNYFFHMGINGVWIAYCADFFIRSLMYLVRFRRGRWKNILV
jgi:putative MATE family efflux protein